MESISTTRMDNAADRRSVITLLLVMFSIIINLLLSDMLESDKVGPFFFITIIFTSAI
jgi:hypothetical protein